jgi:hypothetical protein
MWRSRRGLRWTGPAPLPPPETSGKEGSVITVDVDGTLLSVIIAKISKHYIYYMHDGCAAPEGRRAGNWTYYFGAAEKGMSRK